MAEYYIRTPDRNESRGPFSPSDLQTLAEADQITVNTLHFDEAKKEWIPIGVNLELKEQVFSEREELKLEINKSEEVEKIPQKKKSVAKRQKKIIVSEILASAETETKHARARRRRENSLKYAVILNNYALAVIMLFSAAILIGAHWDTIQTTVSTKQFKQLLNYPLLCLALIDSLMAISAFLGSKGLYSLLRGRALLSLGFGVYIGWALGDPKVLIAFLAVGLATFGITLSSRFIMSFVLVVFGLGGSIFLTNLAVNGYFEGLLDSCFLKVF